MRVHTAVYDLLRTHGMTTIFGNPGSNELPFLGEMPGDFRYVLGLHEQVVVGMADGFAQASGRSAFVNLHAASGTGNAMGALTNAAYAHTPLVITAGQQVRSMIGLEAMLSNVHAPTLPQPLVKLSEEPAAAGDVPRAMSQAAITAQTHPRGPVYVSVPYDDWQQEVDANVEEIVLREVSEARSLSRDQLTELAGILEAAGNPLIVLGPEVDVERANADAVAVAEKLRAPVWVAPSASRCPFPTGHPNFRGVLPASIAGISAILSDHDVVLVVGAPVFRYHQFEPGSYLPTGCRVVHLTSDPGEAARAPFGSAIIVGVREALADLATTLNPSARPELVGRPRPALVGSGGGETAEAADAGNSDVSSGRMSPEAVFDIINRVSPRDAVYVNESTSTVTELWDRIEMNDPGSYYFPASGGLGFGMPAAVGIQLAQPERQVVAIIGDGSANYSITALWTAAQENVPVVFVILNNGTYGALRGFAELLRTPNAPGLDVPGIDFCALAQGYGVQGYATGDAEEFEERFVAALGANKPTLIEVRTTSTSPF